MVETLKHPSSKAQSLLILTACLQWFGARCVEETQLCLNKAAGTHPSGDGSYWRKRPGALRACAACAELCAVTALDTLSGIHSIQIKAGVDMYAHTKPQRGHTLRHKQLYSGGQPVYFFSPVLQPLLIHRALTLQLLKWMSKLPLTCVGRSPVLFTFY